MKIRIPPCHKLWSLTALIECTFIYYAPTCKLYPPYVNMMAWVLDNWDGYLELSIDMILRINIKKLSLIVLKPMIHWCKYHDIPTLHNSE